MAALGKGSKAAARALIFARDPHCVKVVRDVFTGDVLETWIDYKREAEVWQYNLRPHPLEFHLYYDI